MNEHDNFDDSPELRELRHLHQDDRMPPDMRERVLRRAQLSRSPEPKDGRGRGDELALGDRLALEQNGLLENDGLLESDGLLGQNDVAAASLTSAEPSPWDERAPRSGARRGWMLLGASAALSAAAALALWVGLPPSRVVVESEHGEPISLAARPYTADELGALGVQPGVSEVRVVGSLVPGSLTRLPPLPPHQRIRCGYHFHLREPGVTTGDGIHVEYARCRAPENLIDDGATCVEVTAIGRMRSDGHVDATRLTPRLVTPCAFPE